MITHCPWPTTADFGEFAACWVLRNAMDMTWEAGPPSKTFDLSVDNPLRRAWTLTHVSEMPPFPMAIQHFCMGITNDDERHLILVLNSFSPTFAMWDSLAKEYHNPSLRRGLLREGSAIRRYLVKNSLPLPTHLNSIPERPTNAKV